VNKTEFLDSHKRVKEIQHALHIQASLTAGAEEIKTYANERVSHHITSHHIRHITEHSPSDCLLTADRETRFFVIFWPPFFKSSNRSRAFG
jgi:hypothetical protein